MEQPHGFQTRSKRVPNLRRGRQWAMAGLVREFLVIQLTRRTGRTGTRAEHGLLAVSEGAMTLPLHHPYFMKYFTLDWCHAADDKFDLQRSAYQQYSRRLDEMQGLLPADGLALARLPGVDDGLVVKVRYNRARQVLSLTLRAGEAVMAYYDLVEKQPMARVRLSLPRVRYSRGWTHRTQLAVPLWSRVHHPL